jgi:hypothetical protein
MEFKGQKVLKELTSLFPKFRQKNQTESGDITND